MRRHADLVLAVALTALGIAIVTAGERRGPLWANVLAMLVYGGLLAHRQRTPVPAAYGFAGLVVLLAVALTPPPDNITVFFGLLLFAYAAGAAREPALTRAYMPVLLACITVANIVLPGTQAGDWIFPPAMSVAAYLAGRNVIYRAALAAELHEANLRAEEAQALAEQRAVAGERRRIAREMHDVVAHSISVMVVQAGGARRILDRDPSSLRSQERAEQAAAHIERTGRETLLEMRRLLGMMHGGHEPAELEPSPTLDALPALAERLGARLEVAGEPQPIAAGLAIGAYRIVEESLAGATGGRVRIEWAPAELAILVDGLAAPPPAAVLERAALYDGTLDVHLQHLSVRFPLEPVGVP